MYQVQEGKPLSGFRGLPLGTGGVQACFERFCAYDLFQSRNAAGSLVTIPVHRVMVFRSSEWSRFVM